MCVCVCARACVCVWRDLNFLKRKRRKRKKEKLVRPFVSLIIFFLLLRSNRGVRVPYSNKAPPSGHGVLRPRGASRFAKGHNNVTCRGSRSSGKFCPAQALVSTSSPKKNVLLLQEAAILLGAHVRLPPAKTKTKKNKLTSSGKMLPLVWYAPSGLACPPSPASSMRVVVDGCDAGSGAGAVLKLPVGGGCCVEPGTTTR